MAGVYEIIYSYIKFLRVSTCFTDARAASRAIFVTGQGVAENPKDQNYDAPNEK